MRLQGGKLRLSASDVASHLGCRHLTALDLQAALGELEPPVWRDPTVETLQQLGFRHEAAYLDHLRELELSVVQAVAEDGGSAFDATVAAMLGGGDVIVQPTLVDGDWYGRADFLVRVPGDSALGPWSYEAIDTKLARQTRAGTILQLCLYSDIVGQVQGRLPEHMHVVPPGSGFERETFRVRDYLAYYRFVKRRLTDAIVGSARGLDTTYPEPVPQCDVCRWWPRCDRRRRDDDHLSLVAGISRLQRRELSAWGVETLADLARLPLPFERRPSRGSVDGYVRVREQARVQLEGRQRGELVYELLEREPERGFERLPQPSPGDVFLDFEGDPYVGTVGLEYLFGWAVVDDTGSPTYHSRWALSPEQERRAFEELVDALMQRWEQYPGLHIYHYGSYEPGTLKRLMGRYAVRDDDVDRMLRAELFVDLCSITKQILRASVEGYSIKDLEPLYGYERVVSLQQASRDLRVLERSLELGQVDSLPNGARATVAGYNRDDCLSALHLRDWLEQLRGELVLSGVELPRPTVTDGAPSGHVDERQQRVQELMRRLLGRVPPHRDDRSEEQQAEWLLAYVFDWHRREEKAVWWEYFRLAKLGDEELLGEKAGIAGLELIGEVGGSARCPVHRYRFPAQDTDISTHSELHSAGGEKLGKVESIDTQVRTIDIKKRRDTACLHPTAAFAHSVVRTTVLADALIRIGEWVADHDVDAPGRYRAARDLLLSHPPRLGTLPSEPSPLQMDGEPSVATARRLALELDGGVLAIQGPPGAGKTYTGARMICELVRAGKRVGITAPSHKVIRNLLDQVIAAAAEEELPLRCIQKVSGEATEYDGGPLRETTHNQDVVTALDEGTAQVGAGTAWLWAREEVGPVDALIVDEAAQMSLANVLAVAQGAHNLVLLGDPRQLEQPSQGSHPEGADVSALQHLLAGEQTLAAHRGLFLAETWRLPPPICAFTSELFYEDRLQSRRGLDRQALIGETPFAGAGLWFAPVEHDGNQNSSREEVGRVAELYATLTSSDLKWIDRLGEEAPITDKEILIVAPYNAHVGALGEALPDARIGTVDKFQGAEAPIVIYSMATSSPEEAPHGMEFLFSLNRLNVATSRARCTCILVANPLLFEPECRTPRQVQLANAFCRYLELATTVRLG